MIRLLAAAISRSHRLSAVEAGQLVCELLQCSDGSRVVAETRRLNEKISALLLHMMATRYRAAAQVFGVPLATVVEEQRRQREEAPAAQAGSSGETAAARAEADPAGAATSEGEAEGGAGKAESKSQAKEPSYISNLELPKTVEEFPGTPGTRPGRREAQTSGDDVGGILWRRLQWWTCREHTETQKLERLFQEERPPGPAPWRASSTACSISTFPWPWTIPSSAG